MIIKNQSYFLCKHPMLRASHIILILSLNKSQLHFILCSPSWLQFWKCCVERQQLHFMYMAFLSCITRISSSFLHILAIPVREETFLTLSKSGFSWTQQASVVSGWVVSDAVVPASDVGCSLSSCCFTSGPDPSEFTGESREEQPQCLVPARRREVQKLLSSGFGPAQL